MIKAVTIQREGKRRADAEVLDVIGLMMDDPDSGVSSATHAAITLIRQSPQFQQYLPRLRGSQSGNIQGVQPDNGESDHAPGGRKP